jgi:hypothetical protein
MILKNDVSYKNRWLPKNVWHKQKCDWLTVCSDEVSDDNVNQHPDAIHQNHNVDPPTHKLKNKWWKNMGLLMYNVKFRIPCNICKGIPHNIMENNPFLTMGAMKKVDPHKFQKLTTNAMWQTKG